MSVIKEMQQKVEEFYPKIKAVYNEISKHIVGQESVVTRVLIGLFSNGHVLLEGVPGLAKTTLIKTLGEILDLEFKRIQFTPDLLPADIIGIQIYSQKEEKFYTKKGPIFTNLLLADEINRAPSKVQSALLEAMQERQVTIGEETYKLPEPFFVLATQNPIEQEGTYNLPEAQLDRFMLKILVDYPLKEEEVKILDIALNMDSISVEKILSKEEIIEIQSLVKDIYIDEKLKYYIIDIVNATRRPENYGLDDIKPYIEYGASPRASIYLYITSKTYAFLKGRAYVTPEEIKSLAYDILRHRIGLSYEAEAEDKTADDIISEILDKIETP